MGIWSGIQREIDCKYLSGTAAVLVLREGEKWDGGLSIRKQS